MSHTEFMQHIPNPPELIILKALWVHEAMPVKRLHEMYAKDLKWSFSSTRKTLTRMVDKGMVHMLEGEGVTHYQACVSKTTMLAHLTRDFMYRVLETDGPVPAAVYTNSRLLSDDDLDEIEGLI